MNGKSSDARGFFQDVMSEDDHAESDTLCTQDSDTDMVMFLPGPIGLNAHWGAGVVTYVKPDSQADHQGVELGWVLHEIDGEPYGEALLNKKRAGTEPYNIAFRETAPREGSCPISWCRFMCFCRGPIAEAVTKGPCCSTFFQCFSNFYATLCLNNAPDCVGFCLSCCGCGATAGSGASSVRGALPPMVPYYKRIKAGWGMPPVDFFLHIRRAAALGQLTNADIVSTQERSCLKKEGMLKNPLLRERVAFPIMNFVVWRRSSTYLLVGMNLILMGFAWYGVLHHRKLARQDIRIIEKRLDGYGDWKDALEGAETATFRMYIQHAVAMMFNKLIAETSEYIIIKEWFRAVIKSVILIPLLGAAYTWTNWRYSSYCLRAAWVLMIAMPFITCTIPTRLLLNFEDVIVGDVEKLKEEMRMHYNIDGRLIFMLDSANILCRTKSFETDSFENVGLAISDVKQRRSTTYSQMLSLCTFTRKLDESWLIKHFTSYGDEAHKAHIRCLQARERIEKASRMAKDKQKKAFAEAQESWQAVCELVYDMHSAASMQDSQMNTQQRELQDLAKLFINDGLAGVTEGINVAVGILNGLSSFKNLWPAALSLGPGMLKGAMRAKSIAPEASMPGAFVIILPWIYAPLAWSLFNCIVQIFGNWAFLLAMASFTFYPLLISFVGMCFSVYAPHRFDQTAELLVVFKRIETSAVFLTIFFILLFLYTSYLHASTAKEDHPVLRLLLNYLMEESVEMRQFIHERFQKFDLLQWLLSHPMQVLQHTFVSLEPFLSFFQKLLLVSIVSTDWMLARVAYERQFEYLVMNRECLPYHTNQEDMEELVEGRKKRLDALVVAFGGCIGEDDKDTRELVRKHGEK